MAPTTMFINYVDGDDVHDLRHKQKALSYVGKLVRRRAQPKPGPKIAPSKPKKVICPTIASSVFNEPESEEGNQPRRRTESDPLPTNRDQQRPALPKCLSSMGPCVRAITELEGNILRFYAEKALVLFYSCELGTIYGNTVAGHRFFPVLRETLQNAIQHEILVLESLVAATASLMMATLVSASDENLDFRLSAQKSASKAISTLQARLDASDKASRLNNLHAVLHLGLAALVFGDLASAQIHLSAFKTMLKADTFEGDIYRCLLETARLCDIYVATWAGQSPGLESSWTGEFLESIKLIRSSSNSMKADSMWWEEDIVVTIDPGDSHETWAYNTIKPNGFIDGLESKAVPSLLMDEMKLYAASKSSLAHCFNSPTVDANTIGTAHRLNVVCLHRLTFAYATVQENLQTTSPTPTPHNEKHHKTQLFTKALILALQICSLQYQGAWMQRAIWDRCNELSRTLLELLHLSIPDEPSTSSRQLIPEVQHRLNQCTELVLWMLLVTLHHLQTRKPELLPWLDLQVCRIAGTLEIDSGQSVEERIAKYTFSEQEYSSLECAMWNALLRQNRRQVQEQQQRQRGGGGDVAGAMLLALA